MKNFVVFDPTSGDILRSGNCQDETLSIQAAEGEEVLETDRTYEDRQFYVQDGKIALRDAPLADPVPPSPLQYVTDRRAAYPSIEDQLDTLYHEGLEGWRTQIAAVKSQHPKNKE